MNVSHRIRAFVICGLILSCAAIAQQPTSAGVDAVSVAATTARMVQQRDNVIATARAAGMTCTAAAPRINVAPIPSWGNFNDADDTLTTPDWTQLGQHDREFFAMLAGPGADEAATKASFENVAHRWIFSHEMGHWVQHCQAVKDKTPWQNELGANRFAYAYWRTAGPEALGNFFAVADGALEHTPNPVPAGADMIQFFNANYGEKLAASGAYSWFQAEMIHIVHSEKPLPTLAEVIRNPAY